MNFYELKQTEIYILITYNMERDSIISNSKGKKQAILKRIAFVIEPLHETTVLHSNIS